MLGRYPGADGMKTGFICSGGFNIVASATQNGRRLIAVVMGYPTARERDLRAADLFDQGFAYSGWAMQTVEQLPPSSVMSPPNMRPYVCGPNKRLPQEDDETALVAAAPGGASDNPISALFSPATAATVTAGVPRSLSARTSLGPRVAFEPIPIWLGASPGVVPDDETRKAKPVAIAAKPVRAKPVAGGGNREAVAASSTLAAPVPGTRPGEGGTVTTLRSKARPGARTALSANLEAKPAAEAKPKLGAVAGGSRTGPGLGRIGTKPLLPVAVLDDVKLDKKEAKAKPNAKPQAGASNAARPRTGPANAAKPQAGPTTTAKPAPRPNRAASASGTRAAASQ
jgi:D-alanyl-D-alanine carboxypeptidase